ncbi:uncharacterized protein LOC131165734 isoform X2 [Malania oleifera]|uniref:uncharacterized protein LOC131165734 isoform X2 n=1 Tax=Malania oleifera TaxID=397392 RepID=UPI0025ADD9BA|nr:uncharacterized protein LOC131165734 isoform X2 [Malania oleifera]
MSHKKKDSRGEMISQALAGADTAGLRGRLPKFVFMRIIAGVKSGIDKVSLANQIICVHFWFSIFLGLGGRECYKCSFVIRYDRRR